MTNQIDRRCHWLDKNRSSKRPELVLFFDTESRIESDDDRSQYHTWRLGAACVARYDKLNGLVAGERRDLWTERDLWTWIEELAQEGPDLYLVAHNIDYDARVSRAFYYLPRLGWTPSWCAMAHSCTVFEFKRLKQKLVLLDSMNIFPVSLADLALSLGMQKGEVDFKTAPDAEVMPYCRNDVEIMLAAWKRWIDFLDVHQLGDFGITVARQAFNAYRHKFMPCKIGIHNNADALDLERAAYHGGRVECFQVGKLPRGTYYKLDVNGLYSAMMSWYKYPRRLVKVIYNVPGPYLDHLLRDYLVIAEVLVQTETPEFPVAVAGRNTYPVGVFATTLTTTELQIALDRDEIRGIGRVAIYEPADLFSKYIDYFTPLRQAYKESGDYAQSQMAKLLRNVLQGKFGQRGHKQKIIGEADLDAVDVRYWIDGETGQTAQDLTFGGIILRQWTEGEGFDSFPAIPAHVNAYARLYMWSLIRQAGRSNVYYMDTDSLLVNQAGHDRLQSMIDPSELGKLKLEGTAEDVTINAKKDLQFGNLRTLKGIRKDAVPVADNIYDQWHFTTMRYAFMSHNLEGVTLHRVRKELKRNVTAGTVTKSGKVKPPRVTLAPHQIESLESGAATDNRWTWEVDAMWARSLYGKSDLRSRISALLQR